jgi:hypothetical protein
MAGTLDNSSLSMMTSTVRQPTTNEYAVVLTNGNIIPLIAAKLGGSFDVCRLSVPPMSLSYKSEMMRNPKSWAARTPS